MFGQKNPSISQNRNNPSLHLYPCRNYNPAVGRFVSRDTYDGNILRPISTNHYTYAYANPVSLIDPSGHDPFGTLISVSITVGLSAIALSQVYRTGTYAYFGGGLTGDIARLYGDRFFLGAFLFPQAFTRPFDDGWFKDDGTVADASSAFRHRWMYEYAVANGLQADGQWHSISVDQPVNTYDNLVDGSDVPTVSSFFIGGLYSLQTRGTYDAKIEANGTASFKNVQMKWLATDVTDAHSYSEARRTGSSVYAALLEGGAHFIADGLAGANFNLFVYFEDNKDQDAVPMSHRYNH